LKKTLIKELSAIETLKKSWVLLNRENEDSFGLSGVSIKDYEKDLEVNILQLSKEISKGEYIFSYTRAAIIKKDNGKYRPLQIPEIKDRIILKAIALLLEEELKSILSKSDGISFAYQKGKGVRESVLKMKSIYDKGKKFILKADIINFFEEINKDDLIENKVLPNLRDDSINKLIIESMNQKLGGLNKLNKKHRILFKNAGKGIPQGNPLSPLLSNIYMVDFDVFAKGKDYSLIRYADDFVILFKSFDEAKIGYEDVKNHLNKNFSLEIHPLGNNNQSKTAIIEPHNSEFSFLGVHFDGANLYPGSDKKDILKYKLKMIIENKDKYDDMKKVLESTIDLWIAIYSYLDIDRYFDKIDTFLITLLKKKDIKIKIEKCAILAQKRRKKQKKRSAVDY